MKKKELRAKVSSFVRRHTNMVMESPSETDRSRELKAQILQAYGYAIWKDQKLPVELSVPINGDLAIVMKHHAATGRCIVGFQDRWGHPRQVPGTKDMIREFRDWSQSFWRQPLTE